MGTASLISALLLGLVGLMAILFCLKLLFSGLLGPGGGLVQRARIRYREKLVEDADRLIGLGDLEAAGLLLRKAFYPEGAGSDLQLIERLSNLNLSILGRIVAIAEKRAQHIENLAIVEDLILSRAQLMRAVIEKKTLLQGARSAAAEHDPAARKPEWVKLQFARLYAEVKDRLDTNQRSLESQLDLLFDNLKRSDQAQQVPYH